MGKIFEVLFVVGKCSMLPRLHCNFSSWLALFCPAQVLVIRQIFEIFLDEVTYCLAGELKWFSVLGDFESLYDDR